MNSSPNSQQKQPDPQPEPEPTLEERMATAQQEQSLWSRVAAKPNLSPHAASVAMNMAMSARASVKMLARAMAYRDQMPDPTSEALEQIAGPVSPPAQPISSATQTGNSLT